MGVTIYPSTWSDTGNQSYYILCTYFISMNNYCYHDCLCNIYYYTLICIRSHICSFILRFSYFPIMHIFLYLYHACIYSFLYSYLPIIHVQVLIPGNILYLINLYLYVLYHAIISYNLYLYIPILVHFSCSFSCSLSDCPISRRSSEHRLLL